MPLSFRKILTLRGPNIWARFPVLEVWVDLEEFKDSPSHTLPGFNERIMSWLPSMYEHRCGLGRPGGFFERLHSGTWMGHILEHVTLELQELAGTPVGFGKARESPEEGVYKVVIQYRDENLARTCLLAARDLCMAAVHNSPYDVQAVIDRLRHLADQVCLGPSTRAIVAAAEARGIPWCRLNSGSLVQFGSGARQRRIRAAETDCTGAIAEAIAQDKELTKTLLRAAGVPVPEGREVKNAADAWEAACDIGEPVVVKPRDANHGRGVAINLTDREKIETAYEYARRESEEGAVIVERMIQGLEHRLLVVGSRVVAASCGGPAYVVGDGQHSVAELVDLQLNSDPRRGEEDLYPLGIVKFEPPVLLMLKQAGLTPDAVPAEGQRVLIQHYGNLAIDCSANVHPAVEARAVEAARVVGLDIAGLDVVADDIGRPLEEQRGAVIEVNASPGLHMHLSPQLGSPQPVGEAIVDFLFAPGQTGRIPLVGVTGTNGKTTVTRLIAQILADTRRHVGMTCSEGIFIDGRRIETGDCSGPQSARKVLWNPLIEVAVFETARGGILREGLGFDKCDVAVLTNVAEADHLGLNWIETPEQMAYVKQTLVEAVLPTGTAVLNAQDALVVGTAASCKGSILYFALQDNHPVVTEHLSRGGQAAFVRNERLVLAQGSEQIELVALTEIPATHGGRVAFQIENALAAAAAAWVLGTPVDLIRHGLRCFTSDWQQAPARFNAQTIDGRTVIVDHGHNLSALSALIQAVERFPHDGRAIVYSAAKDQRESELVRQGELLGNAFDRVILYEGPSGREASAAATSSFRQGLASGRRVRDVVDLGGVVESFDEGLRGAKVGDLLVIQTDEIEETLNLLSPRLGWHQTSDSVIAG